MKISKKRLTEIILQECEMMDNPEGSYNMDGIDKEGQMAKRQLHDMERYARELSEMLTDTTQLESWVQAKLTKAADYIKTVKHYVEYGMQEGAYDQVTSIEPIISTDLDDMGASMDTDDEEMKNITEE
tara:strand:+ start:2657 stop:3040 length:384 start_codon:yes stop_codon:yes gene_type:complete